MPEDKKFEIDLSAIEDRAKELGLKGIDVLGLNPKTRSLLSRRGITLETVPQSYDSLMDIRQIGALRRREIIERFEQLNQRPMSEHLEHLVEVAKSKEKKPVGSLLKELAEPFYQNVGTYLKGDVPIRDLQDWYYPDFKIFPDRFKKTEVKRTIRIGNKVIERTITTFIISSEPLEPISVTPNRAYQYIKPFMKEHSRMVRAAIQMAFSNAIGAGYKEVDSVRQEKLFKLQEAVGVNRGFFLSQGLRKPE